MSEKTKIEWCDSTINFWRGCTKVSPGCANCYAEALSKRTGHGEYRRGVPRVKIKSAVAMALKLDRACWVCDHCGVGHAGEQAHPCGPGANIRAGDDLSYHRRRIFTNSLSDMFDAEVLIEIFAEAMQTIYRCGHVTWIVCTKRPENAIPRLMECLNVFAASAEKNQTNLHFLYWLKDWVGGKAPSNIILLTSVENQEQADKRTPELLKIPAACRGLSVEPMLAPVNFLDVMSKNDVNDADCRLAGERHIDWVIFGGESGPAARPCNVEWISEGVKACQSCGIPAFVKQLGSLALCDNANLFDFPDDTKLIETDQAEGFASCRIATKDKKGGDISEWPDSLRVREFPEFNL